MLEYIWVGLITGMLGPFVGIPALLVAAKWTLKKQISRAMALAIGNSLVQLVWAALAAMAIYSSAKVSTGKYAYIMTIVGALVLFIIAWILWNNKEEEKAEIPREENNKGILSAFIAGIALTIVAPQRILMYVLFYSGFNIHFAALKSNHIFEMIPIVVATAVGSMLTFIVTVFILKCVGKNIKPKQTHFFSKAVAIIMALLGVLSLTQLMN